MSRACKLEKNKNITVMHNKYRDTYLIIKEKLKNLEFAFKNSDMSAAKEILRLRGILEKNKFKSPVKIRRICPITGRTRGLTSKGLARHVFRDSASKGLIRGYKKASW